MQLPHLNPTCTQIQASRNLNIYKKKKKLKSEKQAGSTHFEPLWLNGDYNQSVICWISQSINKDTCSSA